MKRIILLAVCLIVGITCFFTACNSPVDGQGDNTPVTPETTTPAPANTGNGNGTFINNDTLPPEADLNRTTWNIEMAVKEITDDMLYFYIYDYDNKGFKFHLGYYNLERFENGEWVAITDHKKPASFYNEMTCIPHSAKDYQTMLLYIDFNTLSDRSILIPGKYRMIQYFNDREFYLEFELD